MTYLLNQILKHFRNVSKLLVVGGFLASSFNVFAKDRTCYLMKKFISSVKAGETRSLKFRTSWGADFKDASDPSSVIYARRCEHDKYPPAVAVCNSLMEFGAVEAPGANVKRVLVCPSRRTSFAPKLQLAAAEFNFFYGTENRGSKVTIKFGEDLRIGGTAMEISAAGY